ncbi:MAG TPA: aldo/keto reductase [Halieaceae bacterium]|nr:aldo/keto reductase [Halieaceae bacterium]
MEMRPFKPFGSVSALTLGGGGLGQVWGATTRDEAVATARLALDSGITHFDMAPMYGRGEAESVIGEAFKGTDKSNLRFTTKYRLGHVSPEQTYDKLNASLTRSLKTMGIERADLFFLHSQLIEDGHVLAKYNEVRDRLATPLTYLYESVIPAFDRLQAEGKIGGWGFALGQQSALESVIASDTPPTAVQCAVNPLNSVGSIAYLTKSFDCRLVLDACRGNGVPALAIRAVQAGALTSKMDRELPVDDADQLDFDRAQGFRQLAADWGQTPARLAHRYALSIPDLGSVILGVKNRDELQECLQAERDPRLTPEEVADVEAACA